MSGGQGNAASGSDATVDGGIGNTAFGDRATVGGGVTNVATGSRATVGGGDSNFASGAAATIPGGLLNTAQGDYSFAAGRRAKANHAGAFVWADSTDADMPSSANNQFIARAAGGFFLQSDSTLDSQGGFLNTSTGAFLSSGGAWTDVSDAALKENFAPADPQAILARLAALPVQSWNYQAEGSGVRRLGPTAQDFYAAFGLGSDDKHISGVDAHGVAFLAVQALYRLVRQLDDQVRDLQGSVAALEAELARKDQLAVARAEQN